MNHCAKPGCQRASKGNPKHYNGLCRPHAKALGIAGDHVPVELTLKELARLEHGGWLDTHIEQSAGISTSQLRVIRHGEHKVSLERTLTALQALPDLTPYLRPTWPLARRIKALRALGIPVKEMQPNLGITLNQIHLITNEVPKQVTAEVDTRIRDYYTQHHMDRQRPIRRDLDRKQWPRPLDWNNIDDPDEETPVGKRLDSAAQERYVPATPLFWQQFDYLKARHTHKQLRALLHVNATTLTKWRNRPTQVTRNQRQRVAYHAKKLQAHEAKEKEQAA